MSLAARPITKFNISTVIAVQAHGGDGNAAQFDRISPVLIFRVTTREHATVSASRTLVQPRWPFFFELLSAEITESAGSAVDRFEVSPSTRVDSISPTVLKSRLRNFYYSFGVMFFKVMLRNSNV